MASRTRGLTAIALVSVVLPAHPSGAGQVDGQHPAASASPKSGLVSEVSVGTPLPATSDAQDSPAPRPRSVLFYLMDTCRHDRTSFDGYERETTPFLEWLAERSVVFEACYSQAPWTKPSMASMLSSLYPSATGDYRMEHQLSDEHLTWPELMRANGMYTAGFSANIVMGNVLSNFAQGFDHFTEGTLVNRGDAIHFASGSAKKLNEHAFRWLDRTDHWPMLLYVHSVDPHEEYEPEPSYLAQFADPERHPQFRKEWQKLLKSRPAIPGLYVTQDNFDRTDVDSASFIEHGSNLYDADILANDEQMQRLWDKLQEEGWGEDFIFVFTSDHGEEFFEHGGTSHGYSLYDEMIRVPLMIYAPGLLPAGKRVATAVRSLDIYPTLCELLGFDTPEGLQGESLVALLSGNGPTEGREVFSEHREDPVLRRIGMGSGVMVSLRSGRWKFILNQESPQQIARPRFELFDLEKDPGELNNVADAHPDVVKRLEHRVVSFIAKHRRGTSVKDWVSADAEVLEELRRLGYIGEEEDQPDIWEAMESQDPERVRRCLKTGANANQLDEVLGVSPLSMAAMADNVELARALFEGGADVDVRNKDGSTPLLGAAFLGRVEMLEFLLEKGADPDAKNANGDTVLSTTKVPWDITEYIASLLRIRVARNEVEAGRQECAELLRATRKNTDDPTTRLFEAIAFGNAKAVERSLAEGASLKGWDPESGWTPLFLAVFLGKERIARLLIEKGARVHTRNKDMGSTLHGAALMGHVSLIELLIERGVDVDVRDGDGSTPLHAAAFLGRVKAVECLLRESADRSMKNNDGQTALEVTRTDGEITEFVIRLLELDLERAEVEKTRVEVARLLGG
jgi:arylsulfatase A-like enzyme/ankyrin repeat protein